MMKIVSMTLIGNESEIIESFIRYNANFIDQMFFISNCCIDNTVVIIRKLKEEGYPITLIEEPDITYEQRLRDYKYMRKIADECDADWFINLDADEFLTGTGNPRKILEHLPLDKVYEVKWKNYVMTEKDDIREYFIPKRVIYGRQNNAANDVTKVILPMKVIKEHNVVMDTGHHHVSGEGIFVEMLESIMIAHYPAISPRQYLFKLNGNKINFITWINRGDDEGIHQNRQIAEIESGKNIYEIASGYGYDSENSIEKELICSPLELKYCDSRTVKMCYADLAVPDYERNIIRMGQMMALKAYILEIQSRLDRRLRNVLIFGAGKRSRSLFNGMPENVVNILAYIDNDTAKEFTMYNHRIVVKPDWVRFFVYDKIIISVENYYSEIKKQLLETGVDENKIANVNYLFELLNA